MLHKTTDNKKAKIAEAYLKRLQVIDNNNKFMESLTQNFPKTPCFNVLSIGCGEDPLEFDALKKLFQAHQLSFHYIGTDIDKEAINACKKNYSDDNAEFHVINGVLFNRMAVTIGKRDIHIIIARHPIFWESNKTSAHFEYIFSTTVPYLLAPGGILLASLYYEEEMNSCKSVIAKVTDQQPIQLKESTEVLWLTEYRNTHLRKDIPSDCYADRYFLAYMNFRPNLTLRMEKNKGVFYHEADSEELKPLLDAFENTAIQLFQFRSTDFLMKQLLYFTVTKADELASSEPNKFKFLTSLANAIRNFTPKPEEEKSILIDPLTNISWKLVRQGKDSPFRSHFFRRFTTMIARLFDEKPDDFKSACEQALLLQGTRPLLSELFPSKSTQSDRQVYAGTLLYSLK